MLLFQERIEIESVGLFNYLAGCTFHLYSNKKMPILTKEIEF